MPIGRVLALVGALAIVAAYAMPWFSISMGQQSISLSGQFLGRFLGSTQDLSRVMPGARGGPEEVAMLRSLVMLFPTSGAVATLLAVVTAFRPQRRLADILLTVVGVVPLVAVIGGLSQLPPGAAPELGLWVIGGGAAAVVVGGLLDYALVARGGQRAAESVE
jgi:hypothetical protein